MKGQEGSVGAINKPPVEQALAGPALADDAAARVEALIRTLLEYSPHRWPRMSVTKTGWLTPRPSRNRPGNASARVRCPAAAVIASRA
ncbi:hypothetical protein [Streptosporangium sp. NPDC000396]|uniref:hypothetical protein n=1 Tax=Streptosporangium sp. NPDC000396 TaxID=3366185 RepID=UPI0036BACF69